MLKGLAKEIWLKKYKDEMENDWSGSAYRVAAAIARNEGEEASFYRDVFYDYINSLMFIVGGRILNGAGTINNFLLNCAALGIKDSLEDIYDTIKKAAILAKSNYGTGFNFSKLRPKGAKLSKGGVSSGPVSFMRIFDASGSVIETGGGRRAAAIGILNVDHPDIEEFIEAKRLEGVLTQFNISVGITNAFINAVLYDQPWDLVYDDVIYKTIRAKDLWSKLCSSGWLYNDPGLLFLDEINKYNNGWYLYKLDTTNPCGELPLPDDGVCCLGNINMTKFIRSPFEPVEEWSFNFDLQAYGDAIKTMVRFLDDVLDVSDYPYQEMKDRAMGDRRIGVNPFAGLGSTLAMLRIPYNSQEAIEFVEIIGAYALNVAYKASIDLARQKGPFPNFDRDKYLEGNFIKEKVSGTLRQEIFNYGIRNIALLTVPPVGTGSLLAGNISNGLEPIYSLEYNRKVRQPDGTLKEEAVEDYAWGIWKKLNEDAAGMAIDFRAMEKPEFFNTAKAIDPIVHVNMQATVQKYIDGSISKTCNIPTSYPLEDYEKLLLYAIKSGVKGFTTFREGTREGVLTEKLEPKIEDVRVTKGVAIYDTTPTSRPRVLDGKTYQIKEEGNHRTYCTVNHVSIGEEKKPWEVFLFSSSRNHELYAAIGRLASRLMRKTGDIDGVIEELKEIGGENGYLTKEYGYVQSKPQHLGYIIEEYYKGINKPEEVLESDASLVKCPSCGKIQYLKEGGCGHCLDCLYSECG